MKCAIMQPTYLPWLGFFDLIRSVDAFVIYDHVQFEKQSWQQRNKIGTSSGELMLTVPVLHEQGLDRKVKDVRIDHSRKPLTKHLTSIQYAYARTPNFNILFPELELIYKQSSEYLIDLNLALIRWGMKHLCIDKEFIFSSELGITGQKVEALIDVCNKVGADQYLSPVGSKIYIDENNLFPANRIGLSYQAFTHPVYPQAQTPQFISHLSFIDYLFNVPAREANTFGQSTVSL